MKRTGKTVKLSGPGLNCWFAEMMVKDQGPEAALENTAGPMREAVKAVIAEQARAAQAASHNTGGKE
jgi:hypothetical protein